MGTEWVPTRQNEASGTQTKRDTKSRKVLDFTGFLALHEMIQNAKICARNEKVACSSQVTSSIETALFNGKGRFSYVKSLGIFRHIFSCVFFVSYFLKNFAEVSLLWLASAFLMPVFSGGCSKKNLRIYPKSERPFRPRSG